MLSAQMLAGIPEVRPDVETERSEQEQILMWAQNYPYFALRINITQVDLGIEVKIQNIERTERAKRELLAKGEISTGELPR